MKFNDICGKYITESSIKADADLDWVIDMLKDAKASGYAEAMDGAFSFIIGNNKVDVEYSYSQMGFGDDMSIKLNGKEFINDSDAELYHELPRIVAYLENVDTVRSFEKKYKVKAK